eukprot:SAG22_NODE_465_length_10181_cov_6.604444_15_plen_55_part_00
MITAFQREDKCCRTERRHRYDHRKQEDRDGEHQRDDQLPAPADRTDRKERHRLR